MLHAHSGLRWLVIIFLVVAVIKSFIGWKGKKEFNKSDNLIALLLLSFTHLQFIVGIIMYFISPNVLQLKNAMSDSFHRFWALEHGLIMVIAIILITVGRVKSKKASNDELKHKKGFIFYVVALLLIIWAGLAKPLMLGSGLF